MYHDGYSYNHATGCIFNCFYNCPDQCQLLWWGDWFSYGDGYGRYGSVHLQLEYDTGADGCYRYGSGSRHLHGDYYRCGWLYDNGYRHDHATGCGTGCQHHGDDECELLWRNDWFCYGDSYRWHRTLYV